MLVVMEHQIGELGKIVELVVERIVVEVHPAAVANTCSTDQHWSTQRQQR